MRPDTSASCARVGIQARPSATELARHCDQNIGRALDGAELYPLLGCVRAGPAGLNIECNERKTPPGSVVASFIIERPMPREMSLLAADVVHNTRAALDHVVARLKDHFGGDPGRGGFPTCLAENDWQNRVVRPGGKGPLHGLGQDAVDLIYNEQPLHRGDPTADPLVVLNGLDNDDKHRMMRLAFAYTGADRGIDLIQVVDPSRVVASWNIWEVGQPLEDGTTLTRFLLRGRPKDVIRARNDAPIGFATGTVGGARTSYTAMIDRVKNFADKAAVLIDAN